MVGTTVSHYKILEHLGGGGMGVVYKAEDTRLKRTVAVKFLPPQRIATEAEKARFIQEAQAASAMSHPNVCTIHDIQEHEGQLFIVMDFVDGQTLRDRLGSVTLKHAVEIGIQVADGLAAAHERGIVHRDIKPENIMIRKDGIVQIMDFGLAKLRGTSRLTKEGSTIGTVGYMSPEQVQGQEVDHRSDIFSLGVLLYELFAGHLPFKGAHETALLYEIVNVDPVPLSVVVPDIGPDLDRIVLECLEKDPEERYQAAKDVSRDLKRFKRESGRQRTARVTSTRAAYQPPERGGLQQRLVGRFKQEPLAWSITGVLLVGLIVTALLPLLRSPQTRHAVRSHILPPEHVRFHAYGEGAGPVVISPDGRHLAFAGLDESGTARLYVRPLDALNARPVAGTEGAFYPFWSPDGRHVGFFVEGRMKKVDLMGVQPTVICAAAAGRGASWSGEGEIVFAPEYSSPLYRVSAAGGIPVAVTRLDSSRQETSHRWPWFLPDGKHFLYLARTASVGGEAERDAIYIASTDGTLNKILTYASANPAYGSGFLLFIRESRLMAQPMDESAWEPAGDALLIADSVLNDPSFNRAVFSVSQTGILLYQTGSAQAGARLMVLDRTGKETSRLGEVAEHIFPRFSPDGRSVSVSIFDTRSRNQNLWIYDLQRGSRTRFTATLSMNGFSTWSPDGSQIIFAEGRHHLYRKSVVAPGEAQHLCQMPGSILDGDWSPDGSSLLFQHVDTTNWDLWVLPLAGDRKPYPFLQTEFDELAPRLSPDGRWVAYESDESGEYEIYARPFPGPGNRSKISSSGGTLPCWDGNGREIYYLSRDNRIMAAEVRPGASGLNVGEVRPLFPVPTFVSGYDASPDGRRFIFSRTLELEVTAPVTMVVDWDKELKKAE